MTARPTMTMHPAEPGGEPNSPCGIGRRTLSARSGNGCGGAGGAAPSLATTAIGRRPLPSIRVPRRADRARLNHGRYAASGSAHAPGARSGACPSIAVCAQCPSRTAMAGSALSRGGQ